MILELSLIVYISLDFLCYLIHSCLNKFSVLILRCHPADGGSKRDAALMVIWDPLGTWFDPKERQELI